MSGPSLQKAFSKVPKCASSQRYSCNDRHLLPCAKHLRHLFEGPALIFEQSFGLQKKKVLKLWDLCLLADAVDKKAWKCLHRQTVFSPATSQLVVTPDQHSQEHKWEFGKHPLSCWSVAALLTGIFLPATLPLSYLGSPSYAWRSGDFS